MPDVFINYRTGDGEYSATLIERELSHRFGEGVAFRASKSIKPGRAFPEALMTGVRRSAVLLAIIGPRWARHKENDWVHREILEAFICGIPVVPIIQGKTERLRGEDLPSELARLAEIQSLRLDSQQADSDLARIGDALVTMVPSLAVIEQTTQKPTASDNVNNSMDTVDGTAIQSRDITGDVGTVIKGNHGPIHGGKGDIHHHAQHFSGDRATFFTGDNHGGIGHQFGGSDGREDEDR